MSQILIILEKIKKIKVYRIICFQVEIIEETIRYIDALHHQLAARLQNSQSSSDNHQIESKQKGKTATQLFQVK